MFQLFHDTKFDFLKPRRFFLLLSAAACLAGVYACLLLYKGKANLGTDFGGGVLLHVSAKDEVDTELLRTVLAKTGHPDAQIQQIREKGDIRFKWMVRIRQELDKGVGTTGTLVLEALAKESPKADFTLDGSQEVGPAVSKKLRDDAFKAFFIAMMGILLYIAVRFDFRFGVISVITTVHDVLVTVAVVVFSGLEFNLLTITAILTLSGYSLNDTVVIFDRIRENLKRLSRDSFLVIINSSLNETLSRTVITGGSTLLALVPVYLIGGVALKDFALILILGILVGTYSSLFVASPLLAEWHLATDPKAQK